jgi:hypothetical protein
VAGSGAGEFPKSRLKSAEEDCTSLSIALPVPALAKASTLSTLSTKKVAPPGRTSSPELMVPAVLRQRIVCAVGDGLQIDDEDIS